MSQDEIIALLKEYTKHDNVKLVSRGNAAILAALAIVKKVNPKPFILIPDQGGWISFKTYPELLGFEVKMVKTNRGVIDLIDLEKKANGGAALLLTSYAGYFAEQPVKYAANICREHNCILIEDASGALGDDTLCDGNHSDIIVGSFGKWKAVDNGYGGFISTKTKELMEQGAVALSSTNFYPQYGELLMKLKTVKDKLKIMYDLQEQVKHEIEELGHKVLHRELKGLNVMVKYIKPGEREEIMGYCEANEFEYVECPKYIRLEEDAISIELKRLNLEEV